MIHGRPVRGIKLATISFDSTAPFRPLNSRATTYAAEALATCPTGHPVPDVSCQCGFHAARDIRTLLAAAACTPDELVRHAVLDVELGGRVIHHEHGYRGEQQRVLKASFLGVCERCATTRVRPPAATAVALIEAEQAPILVPRCADHADSPMTLGTVSGQVGTEVAWTATEEAYAWLDLCDQWII